MRDEGRRVDSHRGYALDDRVEGQESMLDNYPSLRKMYTTVTATIYAYSHYLIVIIY